jgi:hypothetical protein
MGVNGWIQDFKLGGAHLQKMGGAKIFGVFLVKNHDFTPKNNIFSNFRGAHAGSAPGVCVMVFNTTVNDIYVVVVSFIVRENQKKSPTGKSLTNCIIPRHEWDSNSQLLCS